VRGLAFGMAFSSRQRAIGPFLPDIGLKLSNPEARCPISA
jgi:hypothetical protein